VPHLVLLVHQAHQHPQLQVELLVHLVVVVHLLLVLHQVHQVHQEPQVQAVQLV
jgi:hypothetical protein